MNNTTNIDRRSAIKTMGAPGIANTLVCAKAFGQNQKADAYALVGASTPVEVVKTAFDENIVKGLGITIDYEGDPKQMTTLD